MKTITKVFLISNLSMSLIGFAIGKKSVKPKIITQQIAAKSQTEDNSNITENRLHTDNKNQVFLETDYYPRGSIKKTIKIDTDYKATIKNQDATIQKNQINVTEKEKSQETIASQKNWLLVGLIPTSNYKDYTNYTIQLSYRVMGPLYVSFQTNLIINRPMMGIGVEL